VHRDVKAENVLIDSRTGRVMVTDFGIARVTEAKPLTATGTVLGTVHYMSPEQVMGETIDGRSDLYALGVLAFLAATGRFPFEGPTSTAVLVAHINSAAPRLHEHRPDAPDFMDATIARLLEKRPADRFENADALARALRGESIATTPRRALTNSVSVPSEPVVLSSDDAQQVWARAAELQAYTGVLTPPPAFALRPSDEDPTTRGYDAALVRASAAEAGIDARYVDRALAERTAMRPVDVQPGALMQQSPPRLAGSRTKLEFTAEVDGELDDLGFEEVADEIRRVMGEMITVSAVGRTLTVTSAAAGGGPGRRGRQPRMMQLHISSRSGRTQVRAFEDLSLLAGGFFGGIMGGGGMSSGMALGGVLVNVFHSALGIGAGVATMVTVMYGVARFAFARASRKREKELRAVVERVVIVAREHAVKRLPR
jgi:serine/threonine-protein kinase